MSRAASRQTAQERGFPCDRPSAWSPSALPPHLTEQVKIVWAYIVYNEHRTQRHKKNIL